MFIDPSVSMRSTYFFLALLVVLLVITFFIPARQTPLPMVPLNPAYRNPDLPIETRITNLMSYMTLEEKVGQMALVEKNSIVERSDLATYGIGAVLSGAGAKPDTNTAEGWKAMIEALITASEKSRLRIPILYGVDATHGHANVPGATVFPHAIGLGATRDPALVNEIAHITATEIRATGANWSYSPNLDLPRDIRWGRVYETFTDDPILAASLGAAVVQGTEEVWGEGPHAPVFVLSTPKHFLGAGAMQWNSSSNKNFKIDQGRTPNNENALRAEYLPPFRAAVNAGAKSIMVGLNSWGDTKLAAEKSLITDLLKGELGFPGFVVSDWYGVYEIPGSDYEAAIIAINAGVDMVMLPFEYQAFTRNVVHAVRNGEIKEGRINDAVRRILRAKFALGLFDGETELPSLNELGSAEHRAVAREAVAKSLVLLKNENVLPISSEIRKIRVAGSAADNTAKQSGAWTIEWQGMDGNVVPGATSILEGIRARVGSTTKVEYDPGGNYKGDGDLADIGVAIVGETPYAEGWGDREYPILSSEDLATIERLRAMSKKVVVIIVSGRPLLIRDDIEKWDALVAAWLPGSEGAGIADVLFGDIPFTGALPLPWPATSEQLPISVDGITADGTELLFRRYFGLQGSE